MIFNERVPHPAGAALVSFQALLSRRDAINAERGQHQARHWVPAPKRQS
jgi:hypothetical protein